MVREIINPRTGPTTITLLNRHGIKQFLTTNYYTHRLRYLIQKLLCADDDPHREEDLAKVQRLRDCRMSSPKGKVYTTHTPPPEAQGPSQKNGTERV